MELSNQGSIFNCLSGASRKNCTYNLKDAFTLNLTTKKDELIGPNINLKFVKQHSNTKQERDYFKKKIKSTKKTELCKNWTFYNNCFYKDNCSFAHGQYDLRVKYDDQNLKFKTRICKIFTEKMYCPFGNRCQYRHIITDKRPFSYALILKIFSEKILLDYVKYKCQNNFEMHKIIDCIKMNLKYEV